MKKGAEVFIGALIMFAFIIVVGQDSFITGEKRVDCDKLKVYAADKTDLLTGDQELRLLFTGEDIEYYDWVRHAIGFKNEFLEGRYKGDEYGWIHGGSQMLDTKDTDAFLVYIDDELIYRGDFPYSAFSSQMNRRITMRDEGIEMVIKEGYEVEDKRHDRRVYDFFNNRNMLKNKVLYTQNDMNLNRLEFYVAKRGELEEKQNPKNLRVIFRGSDIKKYEWRGHKIYMNEGFLQGRIADVGTEKSRERGGSSVLGCEYGDTFLVYLDGKMLFKGDFDVPMAISFMPNTPIISDREYGFQIKEAYLGDDSRNSRELYDFLCKNGIMKRKVDFLEDKEKKVEIKIEEK